MIKIIAYANLNKDYMHEKAKLNGLDGEAANMFCHFNEIKIELTVDEKTGLVLSWEKAE